TVGAARHADDPTRPLVVPRRETDHGASPDPFAPPTGGRGDPRPAVTARHERAADPTVEMTARRSATTTAPVAAMSSDPTPRRMADTGQLPVTTSYRSPDSRRRFRLRPLATIAVLAFAATAVAAFTPLIEIGAESAAFFEIGTWRVNDLGTNNAVAGLLAAATMVVGALAWCFGFRWGAGLAGGAGAALAGWTALVIGAAELPVSAAEASGVAVIERPYGYWVLIGAGGLGLLTLVASLAAAGRAGRSGLDPWIAALGAVSFLVAAGGPLLPEGTADWTGNYDSASLQIEVPTLYFVGRAVQLGLLVLCGVVGFLLVRRWGLGLAIGGAVAAAWLLVTAATEQTAEPIGPGYANPASPDAFDLQPHAVTVVGFAMVGFFALVAVVMAVLDGER
ncbi:MAG: hypothetical protein ACRDZ2_14240, partial [Ilumatobacteraceae bacterium]